MKVVVDAVVGDAVVVVVGRINGPVFLSKLTKVLLIFASVSYINKCKAERELGGEMK